MLALGLKTKERHIRSPDGQAASMVQTDGFYNSMWEIKTPLLLWGQVTDLAWEGGSEEGGSGLWPCCTTPWGIDPVTRNHL